MLMNFYLHCCLKVIREAVADVCIRRQELKKPRGAHAELSSRLAQTRRCDNLRTNGSLLFKRAACHALVRNGRFSASCFVNPQREACEALTSTSSNVQRLERWNRTQRAQRSIFCKASREQTHRPVVMTGEPTSHIQRTGSSWASWTDDILYDKA